MRHEYSSDYPDWFADAMQAMEDGTAPEFGEISGEVVQRIDTIWMEDDGNVYASALPVLGYWQPAGDCD